MLLEKTDVNLPAAYADLFRPSRYKIFYGGRGSGKSWSFATALIVQTVQEKLRVLCVREYQTSLDDSVWLLLADTIQRLQLDDYFTVHRGEIQGKNGSLFLFEGLAYNLKNIRSKENIDRCWAEEADAISQESWNILLPTIRKKDSEIWASFNRDRPDDPVYEMFVKNPRPNSIVKKVLLSDNSYAPAPLLDEAEWDRATDIEKYNHIWLGQPWTRDEALVFANKFVIESFDTPNDADFHCGLDFGFSTDPLAAIRCFVESECLYIDAEAYAHGIPITDTPAMLDVILPHKKWPCKADSSNPGLIDFLNTCGYDIIPSRKGPGSVEAGIEFLRSFKKIIIHKRCVHTADEFRMYSYRTDKVTGRVLPVILPKWDHCIDAARYAMEDFYLENRSCIASWSASQIGL